MQAEAAKSAGGAILQDGQERRAGRTSGWRVGGRRAGWRMAGGQKAGECVKGDSGQEDGGGGVVKRDASA